MKKKNRKPFAKSYLNSKGIFNYGIPTAVICLIIYYFLRGGDMPFTGIGADLMIPVFSTILLLAINGTLQASEYIIATTKGAPSGSTYTVMSYVINRFVPGFADTGINVGYGCALSLITALIMGLIAVVYTKATAKLQNIY